MDAPMPGLPNVTTTDDFRSALHEVFADAQASGVHHIDINSGKLHRMLGGYPGSSHRMPVCCQAMYAEQRPGDEILEKPPKGKGASLTIRYVLPRP